MMIMSIKMTVATIAIVVTIATIGVVAMTTVSINSVFAQGPQKIVMNLSGSEEVPPVQTEATGVAEFILG
jgi:hypothetical protein